MNHAIRSRMSRLRITLAAFAVAGAAGAAGAEVITYTTVLSGPAEDPPNASPGTGTGVVDIDVVAHTLRVRVEFSGLLAGTTAAHVHAPTMLPGEGTAGVATQVPTFEGFPLGVTSGTYDHTFDMTMAATWNPAYVTANGGTVAGAEAAFAQSLAEGRAYLNVHSTMFTGGEIRGFLVPSPGVVPLLGVAALAAVRRRRGVPAGAGAVTSSA